VIHIGDIIRKEVESKRLTYKEFGALIHRNEKTIPDIYERESMSTDLLLTISGALKKDILSVYYSEEPLKSLRNDEVTRLNNEFQIYHEQIQKLSNENNQLKLELSLTKELCEAQKVIISLTKDKIAGLDSTAELLKKEA
jgi:hypothetical protein